MAAITAADLKRFAPRADPRIVAAFVAHGDAAFARWEITTAARLQMFMAHVKVESAGLTVLFENTDYSAARLVKVWPRRFPSIAAAMPYAHNPRRLANKVYGDRMGNRAGTDDGWLCRGQGLLDDTGMTTFGQLAQHMGLPVEDVRAQLTSDDGMVACAAATFHMLGCLPFADRQDLVGCTKRVNGGLNGLTDRRTALGLARKLWPAMRPLNAQAAPMPRTAPAPASVTVEPKPRLRAPDPLPSVSWLGWLTSGLAHSAKA